MPAIHRDYGTAHVKTRKALLHTAPGSPCTHCGVILLEGEPVHLDHTPDREGYAGWAHPSCNTRAGAIKGNRARGLGPLGSRSRSW